MSSGLQITNLSNEIVIDQDFRNLEIVQSGTVAGSNRLFTVNFPATEFALAFFEVGQNENFAFGLTSTTQARWFAERATCRYMICAPRVNSDVGSSPGVAVFDSSSRCVFSSNRDYVKIVAATNLATSTGVYTTTHAEAPYDSLVCGGFLGIQEAYCNMVALRTFKRTSTTSIYVSGVLGLGSIAAYLMGSSPVGDWGPGYASPSYPWPLIFGK